MSTVIHWHRPADNLDDRHELRVSVMEGDIEEIASGLIEKLRSQGHDVKAMGGDSTGPGGSTRAMFFDVEVTLNDGYSMTWQHGVITPTEAWPLPLRTYDDYLDAVTARGEVMGTWRRGQVHFNVLENNRKDLAEQIRGTDLDPFHDDSRVPAYLVWVGQHWDGEAGS